MRPCPGEYGFEFRHLTAQAPQLLRSRVLTPILAGSGRGVSGDIPDEVEGDVDYLPAPDVVEGDAPVRRGDVDPAVAEEREAARSEKQRGRVVAFLGHCVDELRRVQWPDRRQVGQATAVVLGFVVLAGGYLGLMDAIWKPIVNALL